MRITASAWRRNGIRTVTDDSINAVGFQVACYYGLTGLACAWYFRREALNGIGKFVFLCLWPLVGVGFCFAIAIYSVPNFDLLTNIVAAGSIAAGIIPYLWRRLTAPARAPSIG